MPQLVKQLRILVVEDEYFLANDLERAMIADGGEVVGPVATACEAFQLMEKRLDAAVLDIQLPDKPVFEIADELVRMHVPFAFVTGYGPEIIPDRFRDVMIFEKPFDAGDVVCAVARLWRAEQRKGRAD